MTVVQRLALGLATLFAVSIIIFISIEMLPGDFGQIVLGQAATEDTVAAFRRELGLDKPPHIRYFDWIAGAVQGDLGTSGPQAPRSPSNPATQEPKHACTNVCKPKREMLCKRCVRV